MAAIKYTQFIGIRAAENTVLSTTFNSTNYSMLVVFVDGTVKIVEGDSNAISPYLPFLKEDNTAQILRESLADLENRLENLVDTRIERIFSVRYPIPDVKGMQEDEAVAKLTAAGFQVKMVNTYPEGMPMGRVHSCCRESENFLTVVLDVRHELPDVIGMMETEAIAVLEQAGFTVMLTNGQHEGEQPFGTVFACEREDEISVVAYLDVRLALPDVTNMSEQQATALLTAAGFRVKPHYIDQMNLDYAVVDVSRPDPRKNEVEIRVASRRANVSGMALDAARRSLEDIGQRVTVERRHSSSVDAGLVIDWREQGGSICLRVSIGDSDITASAAKCRVTLSDGASVDVRKLSAMYSWKNKSLELEMEVQVHAKIKYAMDTYRSVRVDQRIVSSKAQASLGTYQIEGETWVPFKFSIGGLDYEECGPATVDITMFSTYGVFKKEASWMMKFDFKW